MCSISGGYNLKHSSSDFTNFINDSFKLMKNRGPDHENILVVNDFLTLGHQRLSIIDLSSNSNQPIQSGNSFLSFNGEIFNYEKLNQKFKINLSSNNSDTLTLLSLLDKTGIDCLNQLNGMFAFAFYNREKLYLVRDRFGIKPLYYSIVNNSVLFSSEFKCLVDYCGNINWNKNFEKSYLKFTATDFDENTPIEGIMQVEPGHYLEISKGKIKKIKWYKYNDTIYNKEYFKYKKKNEILSEFENLLVDSIKIRLISDVPLCMTLSGGVDSSLLYTLIKDRLKKDVKIFSFSHPSKETDESKIVKKLASEYNDKVEFIYQNENYNLDDLYEMNKILDYPSWGFDSLAFDSVYKCIKSNGYTVVIEGHGSDELFGGYPYMIEPLIYNKFISLDFKSSYRTFNSYLKTLDQSNDILSKFYLILKILLKGILFMRARNFRKNIELSFDHTILPIVLRTFDRITMSNSLENRCPYLDYRIVEFSRSMPDHFLFNSIGTKSILRMILRKYNKQFVYDNKRKLGFSIDLRSLLKNTKSKNDLMQFFENEGLDNENKSFIVRKSNMKILKKIYAQ